MKILIDARFYGLENAGLGRYTINLIKELAKIDTKNQYIVLLRKKYFHQEAGRLLDDDSLNLPENWKKVLADFRHYSLAEQIKLPGIISKEKPDLVHFLHFNTPVFYKGRFVVTIHDLTMHKQGKEASTLPLPLYLAKRLFYKYIFKHSVKFSVKIIVPSHYVKSQVSQYYGVDEKKILVTHEGLDEKILLVASFDIAKKYKLEFPYFIYVGNAYPYKNLERAIEATVSLNQNLDRPVLLAIAGSRGFFYKRLEREIKHLRGQRFVKLLGFVPDKDLGALYKASLGFIYPSLTEGFGLQGLEAIASGTLVLASNIAVFGEIYGKNALYFNPYDFSSITKTMKDALKMEQEKRNEFIKKGQEFIKRYSWTNMAQETLRVYQEAVAI